MNETFQSKTMKNIAKNSSLSFWGQTRMEVAETIKSKI